MTNIIVTSIVLMSALAGSAHAQSGPALLHGNYCGPGNNAPLAPIDELDAACARHDSCTPANGLPTKACNVRLQREAEIISRDPRLAEDKRILAAVVHFGASVIPSVPAVSQNRQR